jgi:hypothetical protein
MPGLPYSLRPWPGTRGNEGSDDRGRHGRLPAGRDGAARRPAACCLLGGVLERCLV